MLSALRKRNVFAAAMAVTIILGSSVAGYFLSTARQIQNEERILSVQPYRNGFIALGDMLRLSNLMVLAPPNGLDTEAWLAKIQEANDILYVRKDTFRNQQLDQHSPPREAQALTGLDTLVSFMDRALDQGLGYDPGFDDTRFRDGYFAVNEAARIDITTYLDFADQDNDILMAHRAEVIVEQAKLQVVLAVGMMLAAMAVLVALRADAIERANRRAAEESARYLAYYDALTNLPNRVSFKEHAAERLIQDSDGAAILLDLDNFKGINDTLGHAAGDAVLRETADRLHRLVNGRHDMAARLSGDEFAAWICGRTPEQLQTLGEAIIRACAVPIAFDGQVINPGVSVGIARQADLSADLTPTVDIMMRLADYALYTSKSGGRGRATVTTPALIQRFTSYRMMIEDLRNARASDSLSIFLQPKIVMANNQPYGFEALVRWTRGDTMVPPMDFIEIAEQNGLVQDIDMFVLNGATQLMAAYNADHGTNFGISVNVSALNLNSDLIVAAVDQALAQSGLPPDRLTLEVTETAMIRNRGNAAEILRRLSHKGVRISVDDFGAGHASLIYVRTLEPDELKIDQSLVRDIETSAEARLILDRMIGLGLGLGIEVVVEGIETEGQRKIVADMGATFGQGYVWGRPQPAEIALQKTYEYAGPTAAWQLPPEDEIQIG